MDNLTAINTIKSSLYTNLTDPRVTAGGVIRASWVYGDEPVSMPIYPIIEIHKLNNPSMPISIGSDYFEQHELYLNLWFYTKNGFKVTISGTEYVNASLTEYYLNKIKETLKLQFNTLQSAGVGGYKHINTTPVGYDPDTQLYYGCVTIRVFWFRQ